MNMDNNTIPPVDYAPPELQGELIAMQKLETKELLEIINGKFPEIQKESQLSLFSDHLNNQQSESEKNNQLSESNKFLIKRAYAFALLKYRNHPIETKLTGKNKNRQNKDYLDFIPVWTKLIVSLNSTTDDKTLNDTLSKFDCVVGNPPFQTKTHQCAELILLDDLRLNKVSNRLARNCQCFIPALHQISNSVNNAAGDISEKFEVHRTSHTKGVFKTVFMKNVEHTWEALEIPRDRINPSGNISNLTTKLNKKVDSPGEFNRILELLITSREMSKIIVDILESKPENERDIEVQKLLNRIVAVDNLKNILETWKDNKNNSSEEFWHKFFEENSIILGQVFSIPVTILGSKAYVGGKGIDNRGGKVIDFIMVNNLTRNAALIEIKTPNTQLLGSEYRSGDYVISSEISGSVSQLLAYQDELNKSYYMLSNSNRKKQEDSEEELNVFNPKCILIAGNAKQELCNNDKKQSFELYRSNFQSVQIVTYDEVFEKLDTLVNLLESK
ncbi:Shedu immune nuclease family protein [Anabaena sp. UHCC 0451]|uniref:Shedu immune nuclease family protein n=1 Tax=Anabaena sp. UHCC 0451 TaxID=2055235 RepID=UPI002B205B13|nr:Shedu immune nuclease family protein [Anabaena sp. UHCC 0451]MEA5578163.1 Shedu immune nuclease family protein [Anabaena sp. UHCC 0451]